MLYLTLAIPWSLAHQAPLSLGFARQDFPGKNSRQVGCHFLLQGNLPDPGMEPMSPALAGGFLTTEPPGEVHSAIIGILCSSAVGVCCTAWCSVESSAGRAASCKGTCRDGKPTPSGLRSVRRRPLHTHFRIRQQNRATENRKCS